jgi:predicted RNase H-like HicB family nuclease
VRYAIVIESGAGNFSAYAPDLPGCIATGKTLIEVKRNMRDAIAFHLAGMRGDGDEIPEPTTRCDYVEVL